MNTILVWLLVVTTYGDNGYVTRYSPPVTDLPSCQRLQAALPTPRGSREIMEAFTMRAQCVQVSVPKEAK